MIGPDPEAGGRARPALARAAGFFGFWLMVGGTEPADLLVGLAATVIAVWTSLRLLPPDTSRVRPVAMARLALHFLRQSVVAGADVALRALDPRMPLRPGLIVYPVHRLTGTARNAFSTLASLVPGTLPAGSDPRGGTLLIHCLDVEQPVVDQLQVEEGLLARALGLEHGDG